MELGEAAQERQMRLAPIDDVLVIVAARDRPAHHQEQHLAQRISDLPGLARVLDLRKVIEQQAQSSWRKRLTSLPSDPPESLGSRESFPFSRRRYPIRRQPKKRVNLASEPWNLGECQLIKINDNASLRRNR